MRNRLRSQQGTAYVEYFIVAAAMATAAVWMWSGGGFSGAQSFYRGLFNTQSRNIAGPVVF